MPHCPGEPGAVVPECWGGIVGPAVSGLPGGAASPARFLSAARMLVVNMSANQTFTFVKTFIRQGV